MDAKFETSTRTLKRCASEDASSTLKRCASEEASSTCKRHREDTSVVLNEHVSTTHYIPTVSEEEFDALFDVLFSNNFAVQMPAPVDAEPVGAALVEPELLADEALDADLVKAVLAGIHELAGMPAGLLDELNDDAKFDNLEDDDEDNLEDAGADADADNVDMYIDELFATIVFDPNFDIETAVAEFLA